MHNGPFTMPKQFTVFVTVTPNAINGVSEEFTARVGETDSFLACSRIVANDLSAMKDTFGGVMDAMTVKGRKYRVFKADWQEMNF